MHFVKIQWIKSSSLLYSGLCILIKALYRQGLFFTWWLIPEFWFLYLPQSFCFSANEKCDVCFRFGFLEDFSGICVLWIFLGYVNVICVSDLPYTFTNRLRHSTRMNYCELSFCLLTGLLEKQLAWSWIHHYSTYLQVSKGQFYKSLT